MVNTDHRYVLRLEAERVRLLAFAADALSEFWGKELLGSDLQDMGLKHGLLEEIKRVVPCSDNCPCLDYADRGEVVTCIRYKPEIAKAIREGS